MFYTAPTKRRPQHLLRYGRNSALIPRAHSKVSKPIIPRRLTRRKHLLNEPTLRDGVGQRRSNPSYFSECTNSSVHPTCCFEATASSDPS